MSESERLIVLSLWAMFGVMAASWIGVFVYAVVLHRRTGELIEPKHLRKAYVLAFVVSALAIAGWMAFVGLVSIWLLPLVAVATGLLANGMLDRYQAIQDVGNARRARSEQALQPDASTSVQDGKE